ncbi:MAG: phosphoribosylglycinamide formyltransferase [Eubacteriales bacterium]|nr:phosphoribosylglycinamide formyltransferase [Eubacteriales bacterium]MDD3199368.1 phosphoribosylglycinamide formyltransferase [Eubacteriales bacterium]MDD4629214.1 phosphoribosylglycinamide formyltransferase [Eubacteriales bacterium]
MLRISVLVSGGGTNLQAVIDGIESGFIKNARIGLVISSNPNAYSLKRAKKHNIKTVIIGKTNYPEQEVRTKAIIAALHDAKTDLVILAGYMSILDQSLVEAYRGRIINIHPSLIPQFCGPGFYGKRVHESVLASGASETGATVHYVDEGVDTGPIILQEKVPVLEGDTADILADRVLETEHKILAEAVNIVIASIQQE